VTGAAMGLTGITFMQTFAAGVFEELHNIPVGSSKLLSYKDLAAAMDAVESGRGWQFAC
jgi:O6-methylguanine-DNA--protein-cysteine methyltransferase